MLPAGHVNPRLTNILGPLRVIVPLTLSALGFGFVIWESILGDGYPISSLQVLLGWFLLGVLGPFLAWLALTWTQRAVDAVTRAEQARELQYRQLLALNTIGEAVNQSLDLDIVLNRAVDHILDLMRIESGEVRLIENGRLVLRSPRGVSPEFVEKEQSLELGHCACGACAVRGEIIAVQDLDRAPDYGATNCACEHFKAFLIVPIRTAARVVGVIHVASRTPRTFTPSERALLAAIGNQVGAAIEKAQLHAQLKTLNQQLEARVVERTQALAAAKEELADKADALRQVLAEELRVEEKTRAHIAHDLHDGVQQIIIGAMYETQAAREALDANPALAVTRIEAAQELLRRIGSEMRGAIYSLRPVALDTHGLVPALRECSQSFERVAGIPCAITVEGTPRRLSAEAEIAAFRIIQEAMNNVEAHAHATHAHVRVAFRPSAVEIEVMDDGKGFEMGPVNHHAETHLGLIGMQQRAEGAGGRINITSHPGRGTCVQFSLPLSQPETSSAAEPVAVEQEE